MRILTLIVAQYWSVFPGLRVVIEQRQTLNLQRYPDGVAHLHLANMRKRKPKTLKRKTLNSRQHSGGVAHPEPANMRKRRRKARINGSKALRRALHICAIVAGSDELLKAPPHASG